MERERCRCLKEIYRGFPSLITAWSNATMTIRLGRTGVSVRTRYFNICYHYALCQRWKTFSVPSVDWQHQCPTQVPGALGMQTGHLPHQYNCTPKTEQSQTEHTSAQHKCPEFWACACGHRHALGRRAGDMWQHYGHVLAGRVLPPLPYADPSGPHHSIHKECLYLK